MAQSDSLQEIMRQMRPVLRYAAVISLFINLLILPMSLYSLQVYDRVMSTGSLSTLFALTGIMVVIFAIAGLLQSLRSTVMTQAADWLHNTIAERVIPISLSQMATATGQKGIQSLRDAASLRQFIGGSGLIAMMDAPWAILSVGFLFVIHPALGFLVTGGVVVLILLAWVNESLTQEGIKKAGANQIVAMQDIEIAVRNTDVVEAMGMSGTIMARWQQRQQRYSETMRDVNSRGATVQGITKFTRLSLQILITATSAWLALHDEVTMGAIVAASILGSRALSPFEAAIASWKPALETRNAYARLKETMRANPRAQDISLPVPEGRILVENLYFKVANQTKPVLNNVSFALEPGEILGIIGPSGSGKTTLARLLTGTWVPSAGNVRLDGADVYRWPREQFGRCIGYLPQDVELFGGTVRDNIARLDAEAPDESVVVAAQLANAHELILKLPEGYSTDIGVGGAFLSAGQRQRVGLARAFYGVPRFLVLDEPDSNLDEAGQAALIQALQYARNYSISTVVITHHRQILQHVDKLLCLKEGGVEAFGTVRELAARMGAAKAMERSE